MLGLAARRGAVSLFLLEHLDVEARQQGGRLLAGQEGDARPADPAVSWAIPLAAEPAAARQRVDNPPPQVVKSLRLAKRQGEARVHQFDADRHRYIFEARFDRRDAAGKATLHQSTERLGLAVDGDDSPTASQNFDDVPAVTAAEIDSERIAA